jgi:hypothetical protein
MTSLVLPDGTLDDASRPRLPKGDPDPLTPARRAAGQHLVRIHDHLRDELRQLTTVVAEVAAGGTDPAAARHLINRLTMRQNHWTLGAFCAAYCRVAMISDPDRLDEVRDRVDLLAEQLLSHLAYEEEELVEPLGRLDISV